MTQGKGARIVVLMGVSGSGKTTIGRRLAERMGAVFADADDYHPVANKQKMAAGTALTDEDRAPWLETLHGVLQGWFAEGMGGVLACSALKAAYRDTLAHGTPQGAVTFCLLEVSRAELERRLAERQHAYMSPKLLDSQLATLEPPRNAMVVENNRPEDAVVGEILDRMER
jgi:gluconokinase